MSDALINVDHVSKKFCRSLRKSLWYGVRDLGSELIGSNGSHEKLRQDEFWALRDVSFELKPGDTIGLIGRNGAGKTTLLKLLSGLIKPDIGSISVRGRMQALIALGAGFNPVLTGRENIYVNASVLGIPISEVTKRFDEIVEFSGISPFIDSPVQSYSSGMIVRLGFSVAVHMEPDILLVDEVLAVGDIPFRAKCHRKLGELKDKGIPWILVSHEMGTVKNHTNKVIFLEKGEIKYIGEPDTAISEYLYSLSEQELSDVVLSGDEELQSSSLDAKIANITLLDGDLKQREVFFTGDPLVIKIDYIAYKRVESPAFGIAIYASDGICHIGTNTYMSGFNIDFIEGAGSVYYRTEALGLMPGIYRLRADLHQKHMGFLDKKNEGAYIHVKGETLRSGGLFYEPHTWKIEDANRSLALENETSVQIDH